MDYAVLAMAIFAGAAVVHALVVRQILKVMRSIDGRLDALSEASALGSSAISAKANSRMRGLRDAVMPRGRDLPDEEG